MNGFEELQQYIRAQNPEPSERASLWQTAIGLQKVDALYVSDFLINTAKKHIEGEITIDGVRQLIGSYYQSAQQREDNQNVREADTASANIVKLLAEPSFTFSVEGFASLHRRIFQGIFSHAGKFRDYDFSKKEWVLNGASVTYGPAIDLTRTLQYDLDLEKNFKYRGLSTNAVIDHFAQFLSGIWQIHPFREGNTRTAAVFAIKYLRTLGFDVDNDMFRDHSWYFRNALVRANYRNIKLGIDPNPEFLILFLRNLLLCESNELKNRFLHVDWKEGSQETAQETTIRSQEKEEISQEIFENAQEIAGNSQENEKSAQETAQETALSNEERVLKLLDRDPKMTLTEVAKQIGLSRRSIQKITDQLKSRGILRREGSTKAGKWIVTR